MLALVDWPIILLPAGVLLALAAGSAPGLVITF
jgi:hypothetical protein